MVIGCCTSSVDSASGVVPRALASSVVGSAAAVAVLSASSCGADSAGCIISFSSMI